jgi:hypothetical protein
MWNNKIELTWRAMRTWQAYCEVLVLFDGASHIVEGGCDWGVWSVLREILGWIKAST